MIGVVTATSLGMIPRAVHHLFTGIEKRQEACVAAGGTPPTFEIVTQFLELYNEEIIDLFDGNRENVGCHGYCDHYIYYRVRD